MNYTYILKLSNGSLYCGWTNNLERRVAAHNNAAASKCTRAHLPAELVWYHESDDRKTAMRLEWKIKKLTKADKLRLIGGSLQPQDILQR